MNKVKNITHSSVFWVITGGGKVVWNRRFGPHIGPHLQGPSSALKTGPLGRLEMSVWNNLKSCDKPEEFSSTAAEAYDLTDSSVLSYCSTSLLKNTSACITKILPTELDGRSVSWEFPCSLLKRIFIVYSEQTHTAASLEEIESIPHSLLF
jgi:hypothetical protein